MSTQITVAVGANGEVLSALALRDGARADRLDSEATKKQARQAAVDKLDDDTNGRENKLGKYDPSRDPAAFARKKREQVKGQFGGVNIQYQHFPLTEDNATLRDGNYMRVKFRGIEIKEDGSGNETSQLSPETVELQLIRNNNVVEFNVDRPAGYKTTSDWDSQDVYGEFPYYMGFGDWPAYEGLAAYWQEGFNGRSISSHVINDENTRQYWIAAPYESRWGTFNTDRMDSIDSSSVITVWQDCPEEADLYNSNERVNGRAILYFDGKYQFDRDYSQRFNSEFDPVEELFLLPYTKDLFFIFVVYTDYNVGSYSGCLVTGTTVSNSTDTTYPLASGLGAHFGPATATATSYARGKPFYQIPPGYDFPDNDLSSLPTGVDYRPVITDAGADKIQQTYLYKVENGKVIAMTVPTELRTFAASLQTDLRNAKVPRTDTNSDRQYAGYEQTCYYWERNYFPQITRTATRSNSNTCAAPATFLSISLLESQMIEGRKYLDSEQRERSLARGYGFGRISTDNHFESPYIDVTLKSFFDDTYFTPMVYQYITGNGIASMAYNIGELGMWNDPETGAPLVLDVFIDFDGRDKVRSTTSGTKPARVDLAHQDDYTEWVDAPQLKNSTHRCWNWNRPDMCWDKLRELGIPTSVLGTRPAKP